MKHRCFARASACIVLLVASAVSFAVTESSSASSRPAVVSGELRSAGPAVMETQKSAQIERFSSKVAESFRLTLDAYEASELKRKISESNATPRSRTPLTVGIGRDVPEARQSVPLANLQWETLSDGSRVAKIGVGAVGAAGIRVGYRVTGPVAALTVRFSESAQGEVFRGAPIESGVRAWSPTLTGGSGLMELTLKPGTDPSAFSLSLEKFSQIAPNARYQKGDNPRAPGTCSASPLDIGCADPCNIDLACVQNPSSALLDIAAATIKIRFTNDEDGKTGICSGTLVNSNATPRRPYIFTAAHCIDSQREAASVETIWFFDSVACNSLSTPPFQRITTGASLRVADENLDVSLIEMNSSPPSGAVFAAWEATVIPRNAITVGLHHPSGDLKTFSEGAMEGYERRQNTADSFAKIRWTPGKGTTEGGSSGSGIFTFNNNCGGVPCYQLRGGLEGGLASCQSPSSPDFYSRMDLMFTRLAPYLSPSSIIPTSNASEATMVEFFNPQFDYYFMTSRENEKSLLDGLRNNLGFPAWYRTGYWFKVDPFASAQTNSLTRYYIPGAAKGGTRGSHFYTALNTDKQLITATGKEVFGSNCDRAPNGYFCNEGTDSYVAAPIGSGASATCAVNERRIWRVFRGQPNYFDDGNHRYLTNEGMYGYMVNELGWAAENVNMCARP
jgi:lysyl endopeptidase